MSPCCHTPPQPTFLQTSRGVLIWLLPGTVLALMPKCPACLAAYVAVATGLGVSIPLATGLRWLLLITCVSSLLWLASSQLRRGRRWPSLRPLP